MIPITYQCGGSCHYTTASKTTLASHVEANHRWSRALRPRCPPPVTTPSPVTTVTTPPTVTPAPPNVTSPPLPPATSTSAQPQVRLPPPVADPSFPQGATTSSGRAARVATRPPAAKRKDIPDRGPAGGPCKRPRPRARAPPGLPSLPRPPSDPDPSWVPGPRVMVLPPPGPVSRPRRSPRLGSRQGNGPQGGESAC